MSDLVNDIIAEAMLADGASTGQVAFATGLEKVTRPGLANGAGRGRFWTEDEDAYIRAHYDTLSDTQMGAALGRTAKSVFARRTIKLRLLRREWRRPHCAEIEAVFDAIVRYKCAHDGNSPTLAWIGKAAGLGLGNPQSVKSQVQDYLAALEAQERIIVAHGKGRWVGIEIAGARWLPPAHWKETDNE